VIEVEEHTALGILAGRVVERVEELDLAGRGAAQHA